jgi:hypothetical protein
MTMPDTPSAPSGPEPVVAEAAAAQAASGGIGRVAGDVGTFVQDPSGALHTGSGSQLSLNGTGYTLYFGDGGVQRQLPPRELIAHRISWLRRRFIAPSNFSEATGRMSEAAGVVLLAGPPGCGRRSAAVMLLCPDQRAAYSITLVPAEIDDGSPSAEFRPLGRDDISPGQLLLLDLSEIGEEAFKKNQEHLHSLQPAVAAKDAKLVVILPADHHNAVGDDFASLRVSIGSPDPLAVLAAHLRASGITAETRDLTLHHRRLRSLSMANIAKFADRVQDVRRREPDGDLSRWMAEAISDGANRDAFVEDLVSKRADAPPRALLLSAAMLEGISIESVFKAHHDLLRVLGFEAAVERTGIEFETVDQALAGLGVEHELGSARHLSFADHELSPALTAYYWDQFPWIREDWASWVRELVADGSLDLTEQKRVAARLAEQCIRSRQADLALDIAEQWAKHGNQSTRLTAYEVLCRLLTDEGTGNQARQRIYQWSRDAKLQHGVAGIVIALCVQVISHLYFDQAIVRLAWLAKHGNSAVRLDARQGLKDLARSAGDHRRVLELLLEEWRFDADTFAVVSLPTDSTSIRQVTEDARLFELLVTGWHRLLESSTAEQRISALRRWLMAHAAHLAAGEDDDAQRLLRTLVQICSQNPYLEALFNASRDWLRAAADSPQADRRLRTVQLVDVEIRRVRRQLRSEAMEA